MLSKYLRRSVEKVTLATGNTLNRVSAKGFAQNSDGSDVRTKPVEDFSVQQRDQYLQFSKAPILSNFGELPFGEIPEPLKYVRPTEITTLSNGIRVVTEGWNSNGASVGVFVKAGSRNETQDNSGVAHLLQHLHHAGTQSRTQSDLVHEFERIGSTLHSKTEREYQTYWTYVQNQNVGEALELLGDITTNSVYNDAANEAEKHHILGHHEARSSTEYEKVLLENAHFCSFRDSMLGQPRHGDMDGVPQLTTDDVRAFKDAHYVGDNIVIVATGKVNHQQVVDEVEKHFSSLQKSNPSAPAHDKAIFTPSMLMIRDDEMINSNVGIFYDAPKYGHEDYYSFLLLKHIFGNYSIDKNAEHLNDVRKQYNSLHAMIGDLPDITRHQAYYLPFSDAGMFGHYFFGNEIYTRQMNYCGMALNTIYGHYLNEVEVYRGRNALFNELLHDTDPVSQFYEIGKQVLLQGRRVPRSEIAKRVAHMDNYHMRHLCYNWFYDAEPSITNWGPIETVSAYGSYKYFKVNTMSTITNAHHTLYH